VEQLAGAGSYPAPEGHRSLTYARPITRAGFSFGREGRGFSRAEKGNIRNRPLAAVCAAKAIFCGRDFAGLSPSLPPVRSKQSRVCARHETHSEVRGAAVQEAAYMATHVTSLLRTGPRSLNFRIQMCSCRFAMVLIANLRHAWTLVLRPLTVSLHACLPGSRLQPACLSRAKIRLLSVECAHLYLTTEKIRLASLGK